MLISRGVPYLSHIIGTYDSAVSSNMTVLSVIYPL